MLFRSSSVARFFPRRPTGPSLPANLDTGARPAAEAYSRRERSSSLCCILSLLASSSRYWCCASTCSASSRTSGPARTPGASRWPCRSCVEEPGLLGLLHRSGRGSISGSSNMAGANTFGRGRSYHHNLHATGGASDTLTAGSTEGKRIGSNMRVLRKSVRKLRADEDLVRAEEDDGAVRR